MPELKHKKSSKNSSNTNPIVSPFMAETGEKIDIDLKAKPKFTFGRRK